MSLAAAACQPPPTPGQDVSGRSRESAPRPRITSWQRAQVPEDLDGARALAHAARDVLAELGEAQRRRVLSPFALQGPPPRPQGFGAGLRPLAPPGEGSQQALHVGELLALLKSQWGSEELAVAALFVGPKAVARARSKLRKPDAQVTLRDLKWRLRRSERRALRLAEETQRRAALYALIWPVDRAWRVTSLFGPRIHPTSGRASVHRGVDVGVPVGTPVRASADGKVRRVVRGRHNGLWLEVDHGGSIRTQYLHLSAFAVKRRQKVRAGQLIGYSGQSGRVTGPHLHYQLVRGRKHVDPLLFRPTSEAAREAVLPLRTPSPSQAAMR